MHFTVLYNSVRNLNLQVGAVSLSAGEMVDVILERGPADKPFRGFMIQTQDEAGNVVGEFSNLDGYVTVSPTSRRMYWLSCVT